MKKFFILSTFIVYHFSFVITNAQSTTILPNRLTVPNVSSLGTCDATAKGSTIFNTTDNKMYYCNGTNWQEMTGGDFTTPFAASQAAGNVTALLNLKNTSQDGWGILGEAPSGMGMIGKSSTSVGVYGYSSANDGVSGYSQDGVGVRGNSPFGIGGYFKSDNGNALEIVGKMNINSTNGAGGAQLVVPSNGNNPIWQDPVAFSVQDLGVNDFSVAHNIPKQLPFTIENFDLGNNYSTLNSEFTAPVKGIYHFDACINWNSHTNGTGIVALMLRKNGTVYHVVYLPPTIGKQISVMLSVDILLYPTERVYLEAYQTSGVTQFVYQNGYFSKFSGHLVYRQ